MAEILRKCFCNIFLPRYMITRTFFRTRCSASSSVDGDADHESFEEMLRDTPFFKLGRPAGKVVDGKITHIVNDDMYIDFGWKFHAVVKMPASKVNSRSFDVGDFVQVKINELEITGHFLGQFKRITLCEADVSLVDENS